MFESCVISPMLASRLLFDGEGSVIHVSAGAWMGERNRSVPDDPAWKIERWHKAIKGGAIRSGHLQMLNLGMAPR